MSLPPPLEVVARQGAGAEEQGRQGPREPPVQVRQPLHSLPCEMEDRAVVVVGGLAAARTEAAVQRVAAVQAFGVHNGVFGAVARFGRARAGPVVRHRRGGDQLQLAQLRSSPGRSIVRRGALNKLESARSLIEPKRARSVSRLV